MRQILPILLCLASSPVVAGPYDDLARLDVIPGWETRDGTHMAGIRLTLQPGWKTYWRSPGDTGIPPHFTWNGSQNINAAQFHWPVPDVFATAGQRSIGYYDSVVLPIELTPSQPGGPIHMEGELIIGVCEEICVPVRLGFSANLPKDGRRDGAITASLLNQPIPAADAGVQSAVCAVSPVDGGVTLTATVDMPSTGGYETVVVEAGNPEIWVSEPDVSRLGNTLVAEVDMLHATGGTFVLDRSAVRITVLGENYAVDVQGCTGG